MAVTISLTDGRNSALQRAEFCGDKRYGTLHSLLKTGDIYDVDLCYPHQIPEILDPFDNEAFVKNPAIFFVVCTDVETGKAVYHKCTDCGAERGS